MNQKGITLTSLAITVIILLILAAVGIGTLGPGGLIEKAEEAKEQAQIDEEKEIVGASAVQSAGANRYGNIEKEELAIYVAKNAGNRDVEVIEDANKIYVNFKDTERYYEVGDEGEVSNPIIKEEIEYAGDITKGGTLDGSVDKPYEIWCIEDLVAFSIMSNGGNTELGLASNTFTDKYVSLMRTLDFNSIFSYNDHTTKVYDICLGGDGNIGLKEELTKGKGFKAIGGWPGFYGIFIGNDNAIKNMYIYSEGGRQGFFGRIYNARIMNLKLSGKIDSKSYTGYGIGGIAGEGCGTIINCNVSVEILNAPNAAGGIIGDVVDNTEIISCSNLSDITVNANNWFGLGGGMIGNIMKENIKVNIFNCSNIGNIKATTNMSTSCAGGIIGRISKENNIITIKNCYNIGTITGANYRVYRGGIIGYGLEDINIENCYYLNNITNAVGNISKDGATAITELQVQGQDDELNLTEKLNMYINNNEKDWRKWEIGEDSYPVFE